MSLIFGEYIKRCKHKNVSIGAKDGSSYMYIGPADFDGIFDAVLLFDEYHDKMIDKYPKAKAAFEGFIKSNEFDITTDEGLLAFGKRASELYAVFNRTHIYLDTYVPLIDRKIVEKYPRETEDDNEAIMVEGLEAGKFWTSKEFNVYKEDKVRRYVFEAIFKRRIDDIVLPEIEEKESKDGEKKRKKIIKNIVVRSLVELVDEIFDEGFAKYFAETLLYKPGMKITYKSAIQIVKEKITAYRKFQLGGE